MGVIWQFNLIVWLTALAWQYAVFPVLLEHNNEARLTIVPAIKSRTSAFRSV